MQYERHLKVLMTAAVLVLSSCQTQQKIEVDPYIGSPTTHTPYDSRYERVRSYLELTRSKITYTPEPDGQDYWQLPEETEALGTGDCEDMAIWLYKKITDNGLGPARLCIGKHTTEAAQMHAWVIWRDANKTYILDPSVSGKMLPADRIKPDHYIPYYSYDGDKKWTHKAAG